MKNIKFKRNYIIRFTHIDAYPHYLIERNRAILRKVSERARTDRVVAQQSSQVRAGATPLRVVSGESQSQQRFWVTARGD
jgi:hypothetical protein